MHTLHVHVVVWAFAKHAWGHWLCIALVTLQVYLHMVDPTRDRYLMNKSADVLVKTCGVRLPCKYIQLPLTC